MARLSDREMVELFFSDMEGEGIGNNLSHYVNIMGFKIDGFISELNKRDDKQAFLRYSLLWLVTLENTYRMGWVDKRNEESVKTGHRLYEIFKDECTELEEELCYDGTIIDDAFTLDGYLVKIYPKEVMFVESLRMSHKTLQQSATRILFKALTLFPETSEKVKLLNDEYFYILSYI